jgi:hypothetical protein
LVEQRLKQMMIRAVNDGYSRGGMPEILAKRQAAEARAEHETVWVFVSGHATSLG